MKNYARATIRKYVILFLIRRRAKKEMLEFHNNYHLEYIKHIQVKYRHWKATPKKINVPKFKQIFHATLLGWRVRRIIGYLHNVPQVREAIDYINLKNDIKEGNASDPFSRQIIEKYPGMVKIFTDSFNDLIENAIWIKKPNITSSNRDRTSFTKSIKERSKPNKIPDKAVKKTNPKRNTVKKPEVKLTPENEDKKKRDSTKIKSSLAVKKSVSNVNDKPSDISDTNLNVQKRRSHNAVNGSTRNIAQPGQSET